MRKEKLIQAYRDAIATNKKSWREKNKITVVTEGGNELYIDKSRTDVGPYIKGMPENCYIGIEGQDKHSLTESEFSELLSLYEDGERI